jgi:hypothetical protein
VSRPVSNVDSVSSILQSDLRIRTPIGRDIGLLLRIRIPLLGPRAAFSAGAKWCTFDLIDELLTKSGLNRVFLEL